MSDRSRTQTITPDKQQPRAASSATTKVTGQGFVGSWRMMMFELDGPPTLGLATFGADGTVVTAEHPVVTPPIAPGVIFTSSGHGAWEKAGPDMAAVTFVGLGSLGDGTLFGTVTARSTIALSPDEQAFSGEVVWTITDREETALASYPGTFQATRIVAKPPAG